MVSSPITDQASPQINHSEEQDLAQLCGVSWEVQVVLVEPDLQRSDFAGPPRAEELSAESFTPQAVGAELRHLYTYSSKERLQIQLVSVFVALYAGRDLPCCCHLQ